MNGTNGTPAKVSCKFNTRVVHPVLPFVIEATLIPICCTGQITDMLSKAQYTVSAGAHDPQALNLAETPAYLAGGEVPDGFNLVMDKGLHVFSPTANVFKEFTTFLETVEAIAGREHGVVKVIVPKEW